MYCLMDYILIEPTVTTATMTNIASLFYKSWYRCFSLPSVITSDCNKLFVGHLCQELFNKLKVHLRMSMPVHSETDGSSERSHKMAIESLHHYVNMRQDNWADHLLQVEIAMNNSVNMTTGKSPMELLYGTHLHLIPHPADHKEDDVPAVNEFLDRINESVELLKDRHIIMKTRQAIQANRHRHEEPRYQGWQSNRAGSDWIGSIRASPIRSNIFGLRAIRSH